MTRSWGQPSKTKMVVLNNAFLVVIGLFVLLSPGLVLTIPGLAQSTIEDLGVAFTSGASTVTYCDPTTTAQTNCKKPTNIFASGYTSSIAVLVHTIVFAAVLYFLIPAVGFEALSGTRILALSVIFGLLQPGLLLTLPALSAADCGQTGKHIADSNASGVEFYCEGLNGFAPGTTFTSTAFPNCTKCTSWFNSGQSTLLPVLVHSIVYGLLIYWLAQYIY